MREVSKETFFGLINNNKLNVGPHCTHTSPIIISIWKALSTHQGLAYGQVFGRTESETVNGRQVRRYFLA